MFFRRRARVFRERVGERLCARPADGQRHDSRVSSFASPLSRLEPPRVASSSNESRGRVSFASHLSRRRYSAPPFSAFGTGTSLGIAVGASSQPWGACPRVRGLRTVGQRAERSGARRGSLSPRGEGSRRGFREGRHARSTAASRTPRAPYHTTRGCTYRTPSRTSSTPRCSRAYRASRRRGNRTPRDTDCVERRETGATRCRDGSFLLKRKRATIFRREVCRSKYRS